MPATRCFVACRGKGAGQAGSTTAAHADRYARLVYRLTSFRRGAARPGREHRNLVRLIALAECFPRPVALLTGLFQCRSPSSATCTPAQPGGNTDQGLMADQGAPGVESPSTPTPSDQHDVAIAATHVAIRRQAQSALSFCFVGIFLKPADLRVVLRRRFSLFLPSANRRKTLIYVFINDFSVLARLLLFDPRAQFRVQPHQSAVPPV